MQNKMKLENKTMTKYLLAQSRNYGFISDTEYTGLPI